MRFIFIVLFLVSFGSSIFAQLSDAEAAIRAAEVALKLGLIDNKPEPKEEIVDVFYCVTKNNSSIELHRVKELDSFNFKFKWVDRSKSSEYDELVFDSKHHYFQKQKIYIRKIKSGNFVTIGSQETIRFVNDNFYYSFVHLQENGILQLRTITAECSGF